MHWGVGGGKGRCGTVYGVSVREIWGRCGGVHGVSVEDVGVVKGVGV